LKIILIKS